MVVLRFRSAEEHEELLKKVKRMKKFTQELEECLEEAMEDDSSYRGNYRQYDDEDPQERMNGRYGYRRMR
jgi:hypothetical protein